MVIPLSMMKSPKMSPKFREEFARFAEENLYNENSGTSVRDLGKVADSKYNQENPSAKKGKLSDETKELYSKILKNCNFLLNKNERLSESALIQAKLSKMLSENPDFVTENGGTYESALKVLTDYTQSHVERYKLFSNNKIEQLNNVEFPELTSSEHAEAVQSLKGNIATVEGNASLLKGASSEADAKAKFNQYQFSPEEIMARNTAAIYEKAKLESQPITIANRNRMEVLDFEVMYNTVGKQYIEMYTRSRSNPADTKLQSQLKMLENEFNKLDATRKVYREAGVQMKYIYEFKPIWLLSGVAIIPSTLDK